MFKKRWHDFSIILSAIWINLLLFALLLIASAALLRKFGNDPHAGWAQLILDAFNLASMERIETGGHLVPVILAFTLPIAMTLILGEGILHVFSIYTQRHVNRKEWDMMVAKSLKDHTVICGAGEMGRQILRQMRVGQPDLQVVLIDPHPGLIAELDLDNDKAIHFQGDMSNIDTLKQASIHSARLVILSAGEDALNLETAYKILQLNPHVTMWVRLHHSALADLLDLSHKPNIHFFCPYQQAAKTIVDHMLAE